jgi:glutathione peroxidase
MKFLAFLLSLAIVQMVSAESKAPSLKEIALKDIDGKSTSLKAYDGKVILLVNVASQCGYTPQYKGLETIYRKYKDQGFVIVGVPSNDFGGQEPGTAEEIKKFCSSKYDVTFPLMEKVKTKGEGQHPLYAALTGKNAAFPGDIKWNFNKFLIGRDGRVIARYDSKVTPESTELTSSVEKALKDK